MRKTIAMLMIIATLMSLMACGASDPKPVAAGEVQMQASGTVATTEGDKQTEPTTGQPEEPTSVTEEAAEPSTSASTTTEPDTDETEPGTQPTEPSTQPTQPTAPTQPQPTEPPHQHSYTATLVAPTCNDKGYTEYRCFCGHSYKDAYTAALGHHFVDEVVAPTSTEKGYTKHTCDRCWYSYNDTYTNPVKIVYDINAAMEAGNAYALSIGFACIDYSLTPANAGYYPCDYIQGEIIEMAGGQTWFNSWMCEAAQATKNNLVGGWGADEHTKCACRTYITYDAATDTYTCYFLYA